MRLFRKFGIILWKNFLLKKRAWILSLIEIFLPTVMFIFLAYTKAKLESRDYDIPAVIPDPTDRNTMYNKMGGGMVGSMYYVCSPGYESNSEFFIVPESNPMAQEIKEKFEAVMRHSCDDYNLDLNLTLASDESAITDRCQEYATQDVNYNIDSGKYPVGGIVIGSGQTWDQADFSYTLRFCYDYGGDEMQTDQLFDYSESYLYDRYDYLAEVYIQNVFELLFIQERLYGGTGTDFLLPVNNPLSSGEVKYTTSDQGIAEPPRTENNVAEIMEYVISPLAILSFLFIVPPIIKNVVHEKEGGVKEFMRMMGLPGYLNWLSWFAVCILSATFTNAIVTMLVGVDFGGDGAVVANTNPFVFFVLLTFYATSLIFFIFAMSTFFNNANIALATGVVIHFVTFFAPYGLFLGSPGTYESMSLGAKLALCLLPNCALYLGIQGIYSYEKVALGIGLGDVNEEFLGDEMTMTYVWLMMLADAVLYGIITWYMDNVKPGPFGQARPFYFPFLPSYWCGTRDESKYDTPTDENSRQKAEVWEPEPEGVPGVQCQDLRKVFRTLGGATVHAVQGANFSAYPGQIMALLGHNGAGKTTTMSMLTGLYSSTSGTAIVNGYDINTNIEKIRGSLGLCPQHNMLFPNLTVREHLFFFGMLKGLGFKEAKAQAEVVAEQVMLGEKKGKKSSTLSGGMKRKLHLGISLIGNSSVVLLDEPTSGMDPEARREIWDLLSGFKKDRTVILTTHFMEEADVLGDRIAIMAGGKVQCYGSSLYLKRAYGTGYRLTMTKDGRRCDERAAKDLIRHFVPTASTISNVSGELAMALPAEDEDRFTEMLKALSESKAKLGVANFGLSVTTLEDVFLRVGSNADGGIKEADAIGLNVEELEEHQQNGLQRMTSVDSGAEYAAPDQALSEFRSGYATGLSLFLMHMKGLVTKRALQTFRTWVTYFVMAMVPVGVAVICGVVVDLIGDLGEPEEAEPLVMSLEDYGETIDFWETDTQNLDNINFGDNFISLINSLGGTGTITDNITQSVFNAEIDNIYEYGRTYVSAGQVNLLNASTYVDDGIPDPNPDQGVSYLEMVDYTAVYNRYPYHARPMTRNLVNNALYRALAEAEGKTAGTITVTYHPFEAETLDLYDWYDDPESVSYPSVMIFGILLPVGWLIFLGSFLIGPIKERLSNAKQVQIMAGVHPATYWLASLTWDFSLHVIICGIVTGIVVGMDQRDLFNDNGAAFAFFLINFLYGFGGLLTAYAFSFLGKSAPGSYTYYLMFTLVVSCLLPFFIFYLRLFAPEIMYTTYDGVQVPDPYYKGPDLEVLSDVFRYIFTWFPGFPHARSIMAMINVQESNNRCVNELKPEELSSICRSIVEDTDVLFSQGSYDAQALINVGGCCSTDYVEEEYAVCGETLYFFDPYSREPENVTIYQCPEVKSFYTFDAVTGINADLIFLVVDIFVILLLLVGLETGFIQKHWTELRYKTKCNKKYEEQPNVEIDDDVEEEKNVAHAAYGSHESGKDSVLIVKDMVKNFGTFQAVRGLSFTVKQGECFGFLGVNGAGKTTSFRMLTGDEYMTSGKASLYGYDRHKDSRKFMQVIGYCPQFDSIITVLTGREMLELFAHIRGVPSSKRKEEVDKWIDFVGLRQYEDRKCGTYSGGNKRKLNVAQALVGDPPIIFLDEPSTGVDPVARRRLWDAITSIKKRGQSVVLTSHSMEECEALCNRLAIMVNGQFRCMGGPQHLKNKFGQGFTVIVKLQRGISDDEGLLKVKQYLMGKFSDCTIKDEHKDYVHFHINDPSTPWHFLFETMMTAKSYFPFIQDYSLSETSLEEVFLLFARNQKSDS